MYRRAKRALDVALVALSAPLTLPLGLAVAIAVRVRLGRPVFFRQARLGHRGRPFEIAKFRTMTDACGPDGRLLPDAGRLTPLGRWLRATSLDELPSLAHVLRGEMSLVGPRPLRADYADRYTASERRRHDVPPGLTGLAQVRARNATSWEARFDDDLDYVGRASLGLDLRLLGATVGAVLARRGISHGTGETMPELRPPEGRPETPSRPGEDPADSPDSHAPSVPTL